MSKHPTTGNFSSGIRALSQQGFPVTRTSLMVLTVVTLFVSGIGLWRIHERVERRLEEERALLARQNIVPFERKLYPSLASKELTIWQAFRDSRAIARFKDSYFLATDGGLVELAPSGNLLRR